MFPVYANPSELEKAAKEKYAVPQFLMMENAAKAMTDFILEHCSGSVVIACGKGNNGGDGYALARLLQNKLEVTVLCIEEAAATEARVQYEMCARLGIKLLNADVKSDFTKFEKACKNATAIVDCIYGTGFRGTINENTAKIISNMNQSNGLKIACDISSGLTFNADYTITMGEHKLSLFSDKAKSVSGQILVKETGLSSQAFQAAGSKPQAYLIDASDMQLPVRNNKAAHKGTYGHTAVLCGDKAGAAILAATAAMNFGSGLTSIIQTSGSNLSQFKISPSLMLSDSIPAKTTCVSLGSGFTDFPVQVAESILKWFDKAAKPAAVIDAGILTNPDFPAFLKKMNSHKEARIVLTPHLSELSRLLQNISGTDSSKDFSVSSLAENPESRLEAAQLLNSLFPKTAVIMKSANTFIAAEKKVFIICDGAQCLAKGGSGDVLAGLTAALLAQGYSAQTAAITASEYHAILSQKFGKNSFSLTPEKLLKLINL